MILGRDFDRLWDVTASEPESVFEENVITYFLYDGELAGRMSRFAQGSRPINISID